MKLGYIALFLIIVTLFYFEIDNYKKLNYQIDLRKYNEKIELLNDNIKIIYENDLNDKCDIKYKKLLKQNYLNIEDVYNIYKNSINGICFTDSDIESIDLYKYINIYTSDNIEELFKIILNNEISCTTKYIETLKNGDENV